MKLRGICRGNKPTLYFHTLTLIPVLLSLVSGFALLGATQCRTGEPDSVLLAIVEILTVSVDLVRQNAAGVQTNLLWLSLYAICAVLP